MHPPGYFKSPLGDHNADVMNVAVILCYFVNGGKKGLYTFCIDVFLEVT